MSGILNPSLQERAAIVAFLRKHTNLLQLAELIERGVHVFPEAGLRRYCESKEIRLKTDVEVGA